MPVVVVDYGSQYTQLIARRVREAKVYCEIVPCTERFEAIAAKKPRAIVLSGGPSSVYDAGAPKLEPKLLELGVPVLGICYGAQLLAQTLGGKVERSTHREYGAATLTVDVAEGFLDRFAAGDQVAVWMSHGDRIAELPPGFRVIGSSANSPFAVVEDPARRIYGLQFHPEVVHTPRGATCSRPSFFDVAARAHADVRVVRGARRRGGSAQ